MQPIHSLHFRLYITINKSLSTSSGDATTLTSHLVTCIRDSTNNIWMIQCTGPQGLASYPTYYTRFIFLFQEETPVTRPSITSDNRSYERGVTGAVHQGILKARTLRSRLSQVLGDINWKRREAEIEGDAALPALGILVEACSALHGTQGFG